MLNNNKLSHAKLLQADKDPQTAAKAAHLVYVTARTPGFTRKKKGKGFVYLTGNKVVKDPKHLERINKLAIPPSWKNVWICSSSQGHIQATGLDLRNRKQYRYHARWNELRNETKFHHLYEFGKLLPKLRRKISKDIKEKKLTQQKVLAAAIDLMDKIYIRIGNESYEKQNGSYGLTTLKDKHVTVTRGSLTVSFSGKKGVQHNLQLRDKKLARIIKQCRDIPGKTLFQYITEENKKETIDSTMLNNYIKEATAPEFTAKDIRTWAGSVQAIEYLVNEKSAGAPAMLDWVSEKLGNSRNICKKYYVHPSLVSLCEEKKELPQLNGNARKLGTGFSKSEQLLMCILKNN